MTELNIRKGTDIVQRSRSSGDHNATLKQNAPCPKPQYHGDAGTILICRTELVRGKESAPKTEEITNCSLLKNKLENLLRISSDEVRADHLTVAS